MHGEYQHTPKKNACSPFLLFMSTFPPGATPACEDQDGEQRNLSGATELQAAVLEALDRKAVRVALERWPEFAGRDSHLCEHLVR